ncbi:hypothetical protein [Kibdelosporangium aridum]|uniref:Uncharacterized protein n=1 Tax=Kibdelosporangium aridum TaxID=2030 RepID=A0A1Y5Y394_KIBAR|nr:hypothetical protein [Kibdelosporangium aridum]SMD22508.1 hypothetical protein SAMN05661093_07466 [Kibdelosporangium aridum]
MGIRTRLVAATMTGLLATAAVGTAAASAAPASPTKASEAPGKKPSPGEKKPDKSAVPEKAVKLLAAELRISVDRARQVFRDVAKVKSRGEFLVKDPAFVAIAKGLGITPQRLLDALIKVKEKLGKDHGKPKDKAPSGSPAK